MTAQAYATELIMRTCATLRDRIDDRVSAPFSPLAKYDCVIAFVRLSDALEEVLKYPVKCLYANQRFEIGVLYHLFMDNPTRDTATALKNAVARLAAAIVWQQLQPKAVTA